MSPSQNAGSSVVGAANRSLARSEPLRLRDTAGALVGPVVVTAKNVLPRHQHRNDVAVEVTVRPLTGCVGLGIGVESAVLHLGDYVSARVGGPA